MDRFQHLLPPFLEGRGQPAHKCVVVAERQEQGHGTLVVCRGMAQHEAAQRAQFGNQIGRCHDIAEAQAWCERLGH